VIEIVVRAARAEDHPALQRIFRRASLSNTGDRAELLAHPEVLRLDEDLVDRGRTRVATIPEDTIIGFASTSFIRDGVLELDDLFTDPDWRRHGAARRLVHEIMKEAVEEQVTRLNVIANEHALDFYRATGFAADGPARTLLGGGIHMHLNVTGDLDQRRFRSDIRNPL
jgi:N-acetylglutamate synthase-like GNAT family acetyltransferase